MSFNQVQSGALACLLSSYPCDSLSQVLPYTHIKNELTDAIRYTSSNSDFDRCIYHRVVISVTRKNAVRTASQLSVVDVLVSIITTANLHNLAILHKFRYQGYIR